MEAIKALENNMDVQHAKESLEEAQAGGGSICLTSWKESSKLRWSSISRINLCSRSLFRRYTASWAMQKLSRLACSLRQTARSRIAPSGRIRFQRQMLQIKCRLDLRRRTIDDYSRRGLLPVPPKRRWQPLLSHCYRQALLNAARYALAVLKTDYVHGKLVETTDPGSIDGIASSLHCAAASSGA
jgi:hypothetical protein